MSKPQQKQPLAEVFGFPSDDLSTQAERYRKLKLCPYNNRVPSCTKDKANDPLGVCSIYYEKDGHTEPVITCPVRFREDWLIAENAAQFFFGDAVSWTSLSEIKLHDKYGQSAGNIDLVLVAYDDRGKIIDFGSLEIQGVIYTEFWPALNTITTPVAGNVSMFVDTLQNKLDEKHEGTAPDAPTLTEGVLS